MIEIADSTYSLTVQLTEDGGRTVVRVNGALDRISAPVLTAHLDVAWEWTDEPDLVIDGSGVTGCDLDGSAVFAAMQHRLRDAGRGRIVLAGVNGPLEQTLRHTRLLERFDHRPVGGE